MNPRFKFRVWNQKHNFYCNQLAEMCINYNGYCFDNGVCADYFEHDGFVIEQCTGFSDKNGNLIYEGDLIKSPNNSHPLAVYHDITGLWRCKENRPNGIWELPLYDMVRNYTVEIIGNIHEQPEQKEHFADVSKTIEQKDVK